MTDFQEEAIRELSRWSTQNPERGIQKATVLAYMARTEALKPDQVLVHPHKVWLINQRTGGGEWKSIEAYIDVNAAYERYQELSTRASTSNGYWEVELQDIEVSG